jgi:hypothetical protein
MRRLMTIVAVVALSAAMGTGTASAKPPPQDRSSSTSYTVAADYGVNESHQDYFHVEAFQGSQGAGISFLEWNRDEVCNPGDPENPYDDVYRHYMFDFNGENPAPADVFTIGNRYSSAHVAGWVHGGMDIQDECTGEESGFREDLYVDIDLTGTSTTIRETNSSWFRSPEFRSMESFSFTGRAATGTVTFTGDFRDDPATYTDVGGRIGLSKYRSSQTG